MTWIELLAGSCQTLGAFFFLAGAMGLLRFPDLFTRLHALTKADNLGLGFVVLGLALEARSIPTIAKLGIIWVLVLVSTSISSQLIAGRALDRAGAGRARPS